MLRAEGTATLVLLLAACEAPVVAPVDRGTPPIPPTWTPGEPVIPPGPEAPRHLLMVSIDTLRRDHVDRYASDGVERMPYLSGLLASGLVLDDHQQCSNWTFHSTSCTLAGQLPEDHGWLARFASDPRTPVPETRTLAVRLREVGFRTMLVSTNSWLGPTWNNAQGYETTPDLGVNAARPMLERAAEALADELAAAPAERWFLHVHLTEPHAPYDPPASYLTAEADLPPVPYDLSTGEGHYAATDDLWPEMTEEERDLLEAHLRVRYDGELRWLDDQLREALATLTAGGWLDDTLLVIWTDHGEQFWEHDRQTHAWTLAAEENDAVLALLGENVPAQAWTGPTHAVDLLPTVLDALDVPGSDDPGLSGVPVGAASATRARYAASQARAGLVQSVTVDSLKLQFNWNGTIKVWDRRADPAESLDRMDPADPDQQALFDLLEPRIRVMEQLAPDRAVTWPVGW